MEGDDGVVGAGRRVGDLGRGGAGVGRVADPPAADRATCRPGHGQPVAVGRPPVAARPAHLLGGDELGRAPRRRRGRRARRPAPTIGRRARRCAASARSRRRPAGRPGRAGDRTPARRPPARGRPPTAGRRRTAGRRGRTRRPPRWRRWRRRRRRPPAPAPAPAGPAPRAAGRPRPPAEQHAPGRRRAAPSPGSTSSTQRQLTGSSAAAATRANTTRRPSGDTVMLRGSPRVNRRVRAYWRGKVSLGHRCAIGRGRSASSRRRQRRLDEDLGVGSGLPRSANACGHAVDADACP